MHSLGIDFADRRDDIQDLLPDALIEHSSFFPGIGFILELSYPPSSPQPITSASPPTVP